MNRNVQTPKNRVVLIGLCAAVLFLWMVAVYVSYQDTKMARYDVTMKPGAVNYGTHSTATMPPMIQSSYRHTTPMISGDAVRAYAHAGHATMPRASYGSSSGFCIHTTSSAQVHSIGGGGSSGNGGMMNGSGSASSARGIRYSGGSVSMPLLAMNSSMMTTSSTSGTSASLPVGPRRVKPTGSGTDGEWRYGGDDPENPSDWWYYDDYEGWLQVNDGDTRPANDGTGNYWKYSGGTWVYVDDQGNPVSPTPIGATPWLLMALLACAYALRKYYVYNKSK